jgi:hypothetical protein
LACSGISTVRCLHSYACVSVVVVIVVAEMLHVCIRVWLSECVACLGRFIPLSNCLRRHCNA